MIYRQHPEGPLRISPEQAELLRPRLAQFRLVFVALVMGVVLFAGVVIAISGNGQFTWPPPKLSMIPGVLSVGVAIQAVVLPGVIRRAVSKTLPGEKFDRIRQLSGSWFSSSLVGAALFESCALMNVVGYLIEHNMLHLVLAGLYVVMMWIHFPTMNRLLDWLDASYSS